MATRAYLRVDPGLYERKALGILPDGTRRTPYTSDQLVAFIGCLGLAEEQPQRGRFRSERILRELLLGADGTGRRYARQVGFLLERGDLVRLSDGRIYVEGWDEWQEGDLRVADRIAGVRTRRGESASDRSSGAQRTANWRMRNAVFERDNYTCRYCGAADYPREWLVMEHVDPKGPTDEENLVTACRPCNKKKGDRTPEQAGMTLRDASPSQPRDASQPNVTPSRATPAPPRSGGRGGGVSNSRGGGGGDAPNGASRRDLSDDEKSAIRASAIAESRGILANPKSSDAARKAARHQLEKLGVDPDEIDFSEPASKPAAKPKGDAPKASASHGAAHA